MADYCKQCADYWGFEPGFIGLTTKEDWEEGFRAIVLCEGCGVIQVDPEGNCITQCDCNGHTGDPKDWSIIP